jgi:hypothetical protein
MPTLNFQSRFAADVEVGKKCQTIRAPRKRPIRLGDTLFLYTGLRRPGARLLRRAICTEVYEITIEACWIETWICVDGVVLDSITTRLLAERDGFLSIAELVAWFAEHHGLPFYGQVIRWKA